MAENHCGNCGVAIAEAAADNGLHPIQELYRTDGGYWCEACYFEDEYDHDGAAIALEAKVDVDDEELVEMLADSMGAIELRQFCSNYGITRERGASKSRTAELAVEQNRIRVVSYLDVVEDLAGDDHSVMCGCGYEEYFGEEEKAVDAAAEHDENNPGCDPKAWANGEKRIYG